MTTLIIESSDPKNVKPLKKLKGYKSYYRIKIGDYRVGIEVEQPDGVQPKLASVQNRHQM